MYLHIGDNVTAQTREIIGVFDIETSTVGKDTNEFLRCMQESGRIYDDVDDIPKSFVVTRDLVYITQVASETLRRRFV